MRIIELPAEEIERQCICLGFEGENNHTRVLFRCGRIFSEYPFAAASLAVQPPEGEAYPVAVVREEDAVVWDVRNSILACEGRGEYQLSFTSGDTVAKSYIGSFIVSRSVTGEGKAPEPLDDFLAEAGAALTAIPETIRGALAEAKASGEFDGPKGDKGDPGEPGAKGDPGSPGKDGFSPAVSVESITGGHAVMVTDAAGDHAFDVLDGLPGPKGDPGDPGVPGPEGFSPTAAVTKNGKVVTISITDKNGTTTATVSDGEDAADPVIPTFSEVNNEWVCDMAFEDVLAACNDGRCVQCRVASGANTYTYAGLIAVLNDVAVLFTCTMNEGNYLLTKIVQCTVFGTDSYDTDIMLVPSQVLAPDYANLTFPVAQGTLCSRNGRLYGAKQEIAASEAWTSAHWKAVTVAEVIEGHAGAVSDVRINGTSILSGGVADIPAASTAAFGAVKVGNGLEVNSSSNKLQLLVASAAQVKAGVQQYGYAIVPHNQHLSIFYGLAKAAGADLAGETVTVGTYPANAIAAIKGMLGVHDVEVVRLA